MFFHERSRKSFAKVLCCCRVWVYQCRDVQVHLGPWSLQKTKERLLSHFIKENTLSGDSRSQSCDSQDQQTPSYPYALSSGLCAAPTWVFTYIGGGQCDFLPSHAPCSPPRDGSWPLRLNIQPMQAFESPPFPLEWVYHKEALSFICKYFFHTHYVWSPGTLLGENQTLSKRLQSNGRVIIYNEINKRIVSRLKKKPMCVHTSSCSKE